MRGYFVLLTVMVWVPIALFKPHVGILVWNWISHMNPHVGVGNFIETFPLLDAVAGVTIIGLFVSKEPRRLPSHPLLVALVLYFLWVAITTFFAMNTELALPKYIALMKVMLFCLMIMIVMQTPNRLRAFVWVMSLSLAYTAIKGGLFTLATGGGARVQGAGGMMEDNNQLAMALAMFLPIAFYFYKHPPIDKLRYPMLGMSILTLAATVGTQSRGGLVALVAVMGMGFLKLKSKFKIMAVAVPIVIIGFTLLPDTWKNRMATTENAVEDQSFLGRVAMWKFGMNVAGEYPVTGGGFLVNFDEEARQIFMPAGYKGRAFHSIYFEVLGEHGYVGLLLFLTVMFTGYYAAGSTAKELRPYPDLHWLGDLSGALQISIVGYAVGGLTVNIATFDFYFHVMALIVVISVVSDRMLAARQDIAKGFSPY